VISWFLSIWDGAVCKTVEPGSNPGRDRLIARHVGLGPGAALHAAGEVINHRRKPSCPIRYMGTISPKRDGEP
jgi:hypothetical protein